MEKLVEQIYLMIRDIMLLCKDVVLRWREIKEKYRDVFDYINNDDIDEEEDILEKLPDHEYGRLMKIMRKATDIAMEVRNIAQLDEEELEYLLSEIDNVVKKIEEYLSHVS